ncbi:MAG: helix-turn-helix domain-containing protein [Reichenbachiella sp.]
MTYSHLDFLRLPDETKISAVDYFYYSDHQFNGAMMLNLIFNKTVLFGYGLASIYFIHTKIKEAKNWSSDTNLQYLNKFNLVAYLFLAYTISSILGPLYSYTFEVTIGRYEIYHHIVNSIVVLFLAVIAIQQPERLAFILQPKPIEINNTPSYQPVLNHLKEIMIELKPYLNPNLTLYDLANLVNIPSHNLSDQINKELKVNFYGFINNYRVEEFKERIISSEYNHLTFLAVAHDVGFNSKASFNRIFKKHMEMTPRQFLNQKKVSTSEIESSIS